MVSSLKTATVSSASATAWFYGQMRGENSNEILTNIMLYWFTGTAASSFRIYNANAMQPPTILGTNNRVPVAVATEAPIAGMVRMLATALLRS